MHLLSNTSNSSLEPDHEKKNEQFDDLIAACKAGDKQAREDLIKKYIPFIYKTAAKVCGQYVEPSSDESSISLIAFNEAIDNYDGSKGASFLSFAEMVIKRRLIDYYRKEQKINAVPMSNLYRPNEDVKELEILEVTEATKRFYLENENRERRQELLLYKSYLEKFGISMEELVKVTPKHDDARLRAMEVARIIASDEELKCYLLNKKELPLKILELQVGVSRKTLERQRKYIIALVIILTYDFPFLHEYIKGFLAGRVV